MPDVSIAISAKDNFSDAITTMRNANQSFNKDLTGTMEKLDKLNGTKYQLKVDTDKAKSALRDAEKQYERTGTAADKMARDMASANYDQAKRNLNLVSQNARQAEKDILSMTSAVEKSDNRASRVNTSENSASGGMLKTLANAGLKKMAGDTLSLAAKTYIGSAFNSEAGEAISSVVGGITTGAAIGSAAAPGLGTAIGAAVGGVTGTVNAAAQKFQKEDDYFKSAVQETYNGIQNEESSLLSSSSALASQRETDKIAFTTLLGSSKNSDSFLASLREFGNTTPFEYEDLTKISRTMLAYGYKQNDIVPQLTKVGDTGAALGLNTNDINIVATQLGRMQSTGKATLEYLNPLLERGIKVWDYLAEASGKSKTQVQEMVSKGLVPGAQAAKAISDYMGKDFQGSMNLQSKTYSGMVSTLEDAQNELKSAMGSGYNEESKKGIQSEIETLSGKTGSALQEAYSSLGKFKAQLENSEKELMNNALTSVVTGKVVGKYDDNKKTDAEIKRRLQSIAKDYQKQKALAKKGNMEAEKKQAEDVEEAKVIAANAYKASKGYQLELQEDLSLIGKIRDDKSLQSTYYDTGKRMGEEFSKGLAEQAQKGIEQALSADWSKKAKTIEDNPVASAGSGIYFPNSSGSSGSTGSTGIAGNGIYGWSSNATGLDRVPYNNYPTLLHEDEKVLTGAEARSQGKSSAGIAITGNTFNVRKKSDIDEIASALLSKIQKARAITP